MRTLDRDEVIKLRRLISVRTLYVSERSLYSMCLVILSQYGDSVRWKCYDRTCK